MHENDIVIKQEYFTGIESAINSINNFFSSGFKTRDFPVLDENITLEPTVEKIITRLSSVDPLWLSDENKFNEIITMINEGISKIDPVEGIYDTIINTNNTVLIEAIDAYMGFKELQFIADNFDLFGKFINGIYTFDLFMKPSQFGEVLDVFDKPLPHDEIPDLDIDDSIFNTNTFVEGILNSTIISVPESLTIESETERMTQRQDLQGVAILVDDTQNTVQEAAEVNYFENFRPKHMKYSPKSKKWMISKEYESVVNNLISGLRSCDSTDDLKAFFEKNSGIAEKITAVVCPFILAKTFANKSKYSGATGNLEDYTKSYSSIVKNNNGAKRFENYDIFTTFKTDKDGTIQFLEDFLKLKLVNDADVSISNHTLLTLFNIFDSRIYLDIIFYAAPEDVQTEHHGEDAFVKEIRGNINKNSRSKTAYTNSDELTSKDSTTAADGTENTAEEKPETTESVTEYVHNELDKMDDMTIADAMYNEHFHYLIEKEIDTIDDKAFNAGISPFVLEAYIGNDMNDSYGVSEYIMEANTIKRRETFQQAVCALMENMETIVDLDKHHRWNANTLGSRYKETFNPIAFLFGTAATAAIFGAAVAAAAAGATIATNGAASTVAATQSGSSEQHTNIKAVHHSTGAALKGKLGKFTPEQSATIKRLHQLTSQLWGSVKLFWMNPRNWFKEVNLMKNTKKQTRTEIIADIAKQIVDMKDDLSFIIDNDDFINEAYYDGSEGYVFQEATTEKNNERFKTAIRLLIKDMKTVKARVDKKQWTNAACGEMFHAGIRKSESYINICQAIKYVNRAKAGAAGVSKAHKDFLESLEEKLVEIRKLSTIKSFTLGGGNIKADSKTLKIGNLCSEIAGMSETLENLLKQGIVKDFDKPDATEETKEETPETTTEAAIIQGLDEFIIMMEQEDGSIPAYMRDRLKMSDDVKPTVSPAQLPDGVPTNPISDITGSIDTKVENGGDTLDTTLGSGFDDSGLKKADKDRIVINVTNNYTNSFNQNSNNTTTNTKDDHSTGKTVTNTNSNNTTNSNNDNSSDKRTDSSSNKKNTRSSTVTSDRSSHTSTSGSNNNNNSNDSVDTKGSTSKKDDEQKLSSGKSIQEMFMFLESKEPRSSGNNAGNPPKSDLLTTAMDADRKTLATQKSAERGLQKVANTGKAVLKPISRTKAWLTKMVDSLIKRDEDKVKAELIENHSYRSAIFKANRIALKLGLIGVAFAIQPYLGAIALGVSGLRTADKYRIKKELASEIGTEMQIIDEKIDYFKAHSGDHPEYQKEVYRYMRMKDKLKKMYIDAPKQTIKNPRSVY